MLLEIVIDPAVAEYLNRGSYTRAFLTINSDDDLIAKRSFAVRVFPVFSDGEDRDSFVTASIDYVGTMAGEIKNLQEQCDIYSEAINRQNARINELASKERVQDVNNVSVDKSSSNMSTINELINKLISSKGPRNGR